MVEDGHHAGAQQAGFLFTRADLANASAESLIYQEQELSLKLSHWDFPDGPLIKNLPANAGDMMGLIPDWETKILCTAPCDPPKKKIFF